MAQRSLFAVVRASTRQFGAVARTIPQNFAKMMIEVPSMGDSITEGTLVSLEKAVGDAVIQDDVIAVIETDKVNVDVRAPYTGVLTAVLAAVDTDVAVGANLFEIDTEGSSSAQAPSEAQQQQPAATTTNVVVASAPTEMPKGFGTIGGGRKASIKFLGKEGWKTRLSPAATTTPQSSPGSNAGLVGSAVTMAPLVQHSPDSVDLWSLPGDRAGVAGRFGRPEMTAAEMEAVELGFSEGELKFA